MSPRPARLQAITALRVGELAMLSRPVGDHLRGALVRVERVIETDSGMAYIVQPMTERRDAQGTWQLVPEGGRLTLEAAELARSLPGRRSGPSTLAGAIVQGVEDLIEGHRPD